MTRLNRGKQRKTIFSETIWPPWERVRAAVQALEAPGFSGYGLGNWEPAAGKDSRTMRCFLGARGGDLEVLHSREPAGRDKSQIVVLLFLSVTLLWLQAGGLGNTCCSDWGPWAGLGAGLGCSSIKDSSVQVQIPNHASSMKSFRVIAKMKENTLNG